MKSDSDLMTFPIPATARWSSSASPSGTSTRGRAAAARPRQGPAIAPAGPAPSAQRPAWRTRSASVSSSTTGASKQTATAASVSSTQTARRAGSRQGSPGRYRCQEPFIRMCVRSHRPSEKPISRCLPASLDRVARTTHQHRQVGDARKPGSRLGERAPHDSTHQRTTQHRGSSEDGVAFGHGPIVPAGSTRPVGILRAPRKTRWQEHVRAHEDRHRPRDRQHPCLRQGQGRGAQRAERGGDQRRRQSPRGGGRRGPRDDRAHPRQRARHPADARRRDRRLPDHRGDAALRDQQGDARCPPLQARGDDQRPVGRDQRREARRPRRGAEGGRQGRLPDRGAAGGGHRRERAHLRARAAT